MSDISKRAAQELRKKLAGAKQVIPKGFRWSELVKPDMASAAVKEARLSSRR